MSATDLLQACRARGWLLSAAESCTGGLIMGALTAVPGSSDVVDRGFVTYSNPAKMQMLGVRADTLDTYGAVSPQVALEMATGALNNSDAQIALSVTGIAGPGGSDFKPEGLVCFGVAVVGQQAKSITHEFGAIGRDKVRAAAVTKAIALGISATQLP